LIFVGLLLVLQVSLESKLKCDGIFDELKKMQFFFIFRRYLENAAGDPFKVHCIDKNEHDEHLAPSRFLLLHRHGRLAAHKEFKKVFLQVCMSDV